MFVGSFVNESAASAYSAFQLFGVEGTVTGKSDYCKSGNVQSVDVLKASREFDQEQDKSPDQNTRTILINNCHSSLQLFAADAPELHRAESKLLLSSNVLLLSSQLFVDLIADPPRKG